MIFLTANYGARYTGFLLALLESIERTHPGAAVELYTQDMPERQAAALARSYPQARWVETRFNFAHDPIQRISSKTLAWELAVKRQPPGEALVCTDSDTLVVRNLDAFFERDDFDVIFTWKDERFALNSGVMLARSGPAASAFFERWRETTTRILRSPEECAQANSAKLPYGGADQMALHEIAGFTKGRRDYTVDIGGIPVRLRAEPCAMLNETNSVPITAQTHIIHYKGGWHRVLLHGQPFPSYRPRAASMEMYGYFFETFEAALRRVEKATGTAWAAKDFGMADPAWRRQHNAALREGLYFAGALVQAGRTTVDLACRVIRRLGRLLFPASPPN